MKALTVWQPWAQLLAMGTKSIEIGLEFNHNIIGRKLKCFRVEDKKEIAMQPQNKEIDFGGQTLACPNCGQSAIVNPFRKDREIYPYCPWCGQKLKEAEDEQTE